MSEFFILQNQAKLFLSKQNLWVDGRDLNALFKTIHKDEAINQLVELSSKDYQQRIRILNCPANDRGGPIISPELMPEPIFKGSTDSFENAQANLSDAGLHDESVSVSAPTDTAIDSHGRL